MTGDELIRLITRGDAQSVAAALSVDAALVALRTNDGDTPLHIACWQKQVAIVGTILAYEPDLNARGCYGRTPLHYAVHEGRWISVPIVGMLLASGADPLIRDTNGISVEDWAKIEMSSGLAEVLDMLRKAAERKINP